MKKQFVIEWIILLVVLIVLVPFVIVQASGDEEQLFNLFRMVIRFVVPAAVIILLLTQLWRKKWKQKTQPPS